MKKIIINARFLSQNITGVQRFAIEISKQLLTSEIAPNICFVSPPNVLHLGLAKELKAKIVGTRTGHLWEQLDLVSYLNSENKPILINLANSAPLLYLNNVVTIHDLSVFFNPEWFSFLYRTYYKLLTPRIVKKAKLIFTVSNSIKGEINERFGVASEKIEVIYNGVSDKFKRGQLKEPERKKENFVLTVSSLDPRKNIKNLILAFSQAEVPDHFLYIIGSESKAFAKTDLISVINSNSRIKLLGRVSDEVLLELYAKAKLFVYVSFYEGFGLPNIEAMAMGTPVLTSDTPAIKEVCGKAAFYVNPSDISSISQGIQKLLNSPEILDSFSKEGLEQSKNYSWHSSAKIISKAIKKLQE